MSRFYFIRHGQSYGQLDRSTDQVNPALTPEGLEQASSLQEALGHITFDRIIISPLDRAVQTYLESGLTSENTYLDHRMVESDFGHENVYQDNIFKEWDLPRNQETLKAHAQPVNDRVMSLLEEFQTIENETVALFGHWAIFMHLLNLAFGIQHEGWVVSNFDNCSHSLLYRNDKGRMVLEYWNQIGRRPEV